MVPLLLLLQTKYSQQTKLFIIMEDSIQTCSWNNATNKLKYRCGFQKSFDEIINMLKVL